MRATSFKSVIVWPQEEGNVDETSVRANYQVLKHLPGPYGMWNDILLVSWGQWVMKSVAECWKVCDGCSKTVLKTVLIYC